MKGLAHGRGGYSYWWLFITIFCLFAQGARADEFRLFAQDSAYFAADIRGIDSVMVLVDVFPHTAATSRLSENISRRIIDRVEQVGMTATNTPKVILRLDIQLLDSCGDDCYMIDLYMQERAQVARDPGLLTFAELFRLGKYGSDPDLLPYGIEHHVDAVLNRFIEVYQVWNHPGE